MSTHVELTRKTKAKNNNNKKKTKKKNNPEHA